MAISEPHFHVLIRLPFPRGSFIDPPPVSWSSVKERELWDIISRQAKGNEIDWTALAQKLEVTPRFLLQQAAWLYERQLSRVKAQMKKVSGRQSATPSSTPGSLTASLVAGQGGKNVATTKAAYPVASQSRTVSLASGDPSAGGIPMKSRAALPLRSPSALAGSQIRTTAAGSVPMSRQTSKEIHTPTYGHSRRGSTQHHTSRPLVHTRAELDAASDSEHEVSGSKMGLRRPNPSATMRRRATSSKEKEIRRSSVASNSGADDEDSPPYLPFAGSGESKRKSGSHQDPSATLRGGSSASTIQRPATHRRATSERITPSASKNDEQERHAGSQEPAPSNQSNQISNAGTIPSLGQGRTPKAFSPRQQAVLSGLSPRHRPRAGKEGSDTSPSIGSSFSDLDDASVTQSALEEALMSNMARGNSNASSNAGTGIGMISQALRSRYFDAGQGGH